MVAVVGMMNPLIISPGLIFDGRSIIISIAGFIGGWVTACIAALMGIIYRVWLGGPGAIMGVSVIASSAAIGIAYHYIRRRRPYAIRPLHLIGFGIIVHICMLAMTMTLPSSMKYEVLSRIAIPVILIYPLGTLLVCVVLLDLESRVRAEDALRESEVRYRELFENANEAIFVAQDDKLVFHNPRTATMIGYSSEELMSRPFVEFVHPDDRGMVLDRHVRRLEGVELPHIYSFRIIRRDGNVRWAELNAVVVNWKGKPATLNFLSEITERKQAEEVLRESEARFRAIFEQAAVGVAEIEVGTGRFLTVNRFLCEMVGRTEEEMLAATFQTITHPDDLHLHEDKTAQLLSGKIGHYDLEKRYIRKDGEIIWVNLTSSPLWKQGEAPSRNIIVVQNITERKRAEEEKRLNQERAERLAEEMSMIAEIGRVVGSTLDIKQVFERVDAEVRKLIPYDRLLVNLKQGDNEFVVAYASGVDSTGRRSGNVYQSQGTTTRLVMTTRTGILIQPADAEEIKHLYPNLYATFKTGLRSTMSVPLISKDEAIGSLTFRSKKLKAYSEQDLRLAEKIGMQIAGAVVNAKLFNDLSKTEKSLRESNELFSLFMRHSPIYTFIKEVTPTQSLVLQASDNYVQMIGIRGGDMVGKTMTELFPPEFAAKITADDWAVVSRGDVLRLDEELNGRSYTTIKFPIVRGDKTLLAGYTIDITERKRAEEEKIKLQGQLLQSQKMESVGRLAGGVAHDFNNMLGVILGHAEMALGQVDPMQPLHVNLLEIRKAAERSADLTRQLLAFARKQTVSPRVLNLNETVAGMINMLQRLIGEDIRLNWLPGIDLWPVKIDPSQIDQILANLCVNARDAIVGIGKITIETGNISLDEAYCADHAGFVPGEYVLLAVSDDGSGMDKEVLDKLFEPFFTTKGLGKGTGLGLATIYGIVKQNNGFINVYSEPDQGTTFRIYLPRHIGKDEQARTEEPREPVMRGRETVLVVEDEPSLLDLGKLMLEDQGYRVLTAGTPGEAIRLAEDHPGEIHLLLTDVVMPGMNGQDLAKKMLPLYPNLKRLFMSGYPANVIIHNSVLDEGVNFIQKPFSRKDLAAKVREVLDQENERVKE